MSFVSSRQRSTFSTIGCSSRSWPSTRASVEKPVLPRRFLVSPSSSKKTTPELLRRADRELVPGELVDLGLELGDLLARTRRRSRPGAWCRACRPIALHLGEHLDQRHLDLVQHALDAELAEPLALALGELADEPRVDRRVAGHVALLGGEATAGRPRLPAGRGREAGVGGELVQVVGAAGGIDQVGGDHRVVGEVERARARGGEQALRRRGRPGP